MSQITLTFPDGNKRDFAKGVTPFEVAADISSSLGKKAISASVNGAHWDLQWPIESDSTIAINTMKGVKEENLVLALLNTYNSGKTQYYSLLNTMLAALGEFDDPEVKMAVLEIAKSGDYPVEIRRKAIDNLSAFNDPSVVIGLLPLLEKKDNYIYYENIIDMIYELGEEKKNAELVRRMAFKAHFSRREHE